MTFSYFFTALHRINFSRNAKVGKRNKFIDTQPNVYHDFYIFSKYSDNTLIKVISWQSVLLQHWNCVHLHQILFQSLRSGKKPSWRVRRRNGVLPLEILIFTSPFLKRHSLVKVSLGWSTGAVSKSYIIVNRVIPFERLNVLSLSS